MENISFYKNQFFEIKAIVIAANVIAAIDKVFTISFDNL